ncbi:MAG: aquaporin, partial [Longimicrobiales bacterium]|nr:aquaporin [Longimicrobiales bacterium]
MTPDLARRTLAEAIATFFLVFVGVGAIVADGLGSGLGHLGISLAFGIVVAAMVYATGHVSGAHLNPAVTVAFAVVGRL